MRAYIRSFFTLLRRFPFFDYGVVVVVAPIRRVCIWVCVRLPGMHLRLMLPNLELEKCDTKTYSKWIPYIVMWRAHRQSHSHQNVQRTHDSNILNFNFIRSYEENVDRDFFYNVLRSLNHSINANIDAHTHKRTATHRSYVNCSNSNCELISLPCTNPFPCQFSTRTKEEKEEKKRRHSNQMAKQIMNISIWFEIRCTDRKKIKWNDI